MARTRHKTHQVNVGGVLIGGDAPIVPQSMTSTETKEVDETVEQIKALVEAGSEIVRITVNDLDAAKAVARIRDKLLPLTVPLVGCFHYNGHQLLAEVPECAQALSKYRINPGNIGATSLKKEYNFAKIIEIALRYNKPVRIGVNWGSLDQKVLDDLMSGNAVSSTPLSSEEILREAIVLSALNSTSYAESLGLTPNKIVISAKVSDIQELIKIYRSLAARSNYALHLGLTEAGPGIKGIAATAAAFGILLSEGIGDTIRASITPIAGEVRSNEVLVCTEVLQSLGLRSFKPSITSCPGCGRTNSNLFQKLTERVQIFINASMVDWKQNFPGIEALKIAVMGCVVNGPGESKHADIGISLPGSGEDPIAVVFVDQEKKCVLRGKDDEEIFNQFKGIVLEYIQKRFQ